MYVSSDLIQYVLFLCFQTGFTWSQPQFGPTIFLAFAGGLQVVSVHLFSLPRFHFGKCDRAYSVLWPSDRLLAPVWPLVR